MVGHDECGARRVAYEHKTNQRRSGQIEGFDVLRLGDGRHSFGHLLHRNVTEVDFLPGQFDGGRNHGRHRSTGGANISRPQYRVLGEERLCCTAQPRGIEISPDVHHGLRHIHVDCIACRQARDQFGLEVQAFLQRSQRPDLGIGVIGEEVVEIGLSELRPGHVRRRQSHPIAIADSGHQLGEPTGPARTDVGNICLGQDSARCCEVRHQFSPGRRRRRGDVDAQARGRDHCSADRAGKYRRVLRR